VTEFFTNKHAKQHHVVYWHVMSGSKCRTKTTTPIILHFNILQDYIYLSFKTFFESRFINFSSSKTWWNMFQVLSYSLTLMRICAKTRISKMFWCFCCWEAVRFFSLDWHGVILIAVKIGDASNCDNNTELPANF